MELNTTNLNLLWSSLIINEMVKNGIEHFVVSPGYRCAPILYLLNQRRDLSVTVIPDERMASFYALGVIKGTKKPCVLVCTSGSAVAHYFPAMIEAYHARLPLIAFTADRPFDAWDVDSNQSINQKNIYGNFVEDSLHLPQPEETVSLMHLASKITHILKKQNDHSRPIHLNLPLKEPLETHPQKISKSYLSCVKTLENQNFSLGQKIESKLSTDFSTLKKILKEKKKILLVVGRLHLNEDLEIIEDFLASCPLITFIDISSSLKYHLKNKKIEKEIFYLDHPQMLSFIKDDFKPEVILHLGGRLVSNNYYRMLLKESFYEIQIHPESDLTDPASKVTLKSESMVSDFCREFKNFSFQCEELDFFKEKLFQFNTSLKEKLETTKNLGHIKIVQETLANIDNDAYLLIGNSTPIRAFDQFSFAHSKAKVITQRGVSGIEGLVAQARGLFQSTKKQVVLVLGDLSLIHDFNSLLFLKEQDNIKILVINNQRGGLFSLLPIKEYEGVLNPLIECPHNLSFEKLLQNFALKAHFVDTNKDLEEVMKRAFSSKDCHVIEIKIDLEKDIDEINGIKKNKW